MCLLHSIFRLYAVGAQPAVSKLYHPVSYPVGRGTPMLNSKIGWDHSQRFMVPKFNMGGELVFSDSNNVNLIFQPYHDRWKYLTRSELDKTS